MEETLYLSNYKSKTFRSFVPLLAIVAVIIVVVLIVQYYYTKEEYTPLINRLQRGVGIEAPAEIYEAAIAYAAKNLAIELGIDLENYDISEEEYETLLEAAATKFGSCHQYRLYALASNLYPCYTCVSKPSVILNYGQTFKIGQTCGTKRSRYGNNLPGPDLFYLVEHRGDIFEVLVAEYVKLVLFGTSKERQNLLKENGLQSLEMQLPPGNKILR